MPSESFSEKTDDLPNKGQDDSASERERDDIQSGQSKLIEAGWDRNTPAKSRERNTNAATGAPDLSIGSQAESDTAALTVALKALKSGIARPSDNDRPVERVAESKYDEARELEKLAKFYPVNELEARKNAWNDYALRGQSGRTAGSNPGKPDDGKPTKPGEGIPTDPDNINPYANDPDKPFTPEKPPSPSTPPGTDSSDNTKTALALAASAAAAVLLAKGLKKYLGNGAETQKDGDTKTEPGKTEPDKTEPPKNAEDLARREQELKEQAEKLREQEGKFAEEKTALEEKTRLTDEKAK